MSKQDKELTIISKTSKEYLRDIKQYANEIYGENGFKDPSKEEINNLKTLHNLYMQLMKKEKLSRHKGRK